MSNLSAKIVRTIVSDYFQVDHNKVRVSGFIVELTGSKIWYGFYYLDGMFTFKRISQGMERPLFLLSVDEGEQIYTVHS